MSKHTTFDAAAELKRMAEAIGAEAAELAGYRGFACDAVHEIADSYVSVYTYDQIQFALEHDAYADQAVADCVAISGPEYFAANPAYTFRDYVAHVGACAEYCMVYEAIEEQFEDAMEYLALSHLVREFGGELDAAAWERVKAEHAEPWDDTAADLDDIREDAEAVYRDAIGAGDDGR